MVGAAAFLASLLVDFKQEVRVSLPRPLVDKDILGNVLEVHGVLFHLFEERLVHRDVVVLPRNPLRGHPRGADGTM